MNKYKIISKIDNHEHYIYSDNILLSDSDYIFMMGNKIMSVLNRETFYEPMIIVYDDLYKEGKL